MTVVSDPAFARVVELVELDIAEHHAYRSLVASRRRRRAARHARHRRVTITLAVLTVAPPALCAVVNAI